MSLLDNDKILDKIRALNLTKEQLVGHELFNKFVEQNNLFKQEPQNPDDIDDNFKPDEAMKYTFRNVGAEYLIPAINEMCDIVN